MNPRNIGKITAALAVLATAGTTHAAMTQNWRLDAGSVTYLTATGNGARGIAFNPVTGNVLVASSNPTNGINVVAASNGAAVGTMNVSTVTGGGGAALMKVRVVNRGGGAYSVYANNLILNAKTDTVGLKIYRWDGTSSASETTLLAPTVIYANNASDLTVTPSPQVGPVMPAAGATTRRIGDGFDVWSDGTNTEFYLGYGDTTAAACNNLLKFNYTEGAAAVSAASNITLSGFLPTDVTFRGNAVDSAKRLYRFSGTGLARYNNDGTGGVEIPNSSSTNTGFLQAGASAPRVGVIGGRTYLGVTDPLNSGLGVGTFRRSSVIDITGGPSAQASVDVFPNIASPNANLNGTGDFDFDTVNGRFLALVTNNYIGSFSIPTATPKKWDGGAATNLWRDAANWSPDGVPNGTDDVVLDHTFVAGAYTVNIIETPSYAVRTLTVGDGVSNLITLAIPASSTAYQALVVTGDGTSADDLVVNAFGRIENQSSAAGGSTIYNLSATNTTRQKNGSQWLHNTARSYSTPYPTSGPGAITYEPTALTEYGHASGATVSLTGRNYGSLTLSTTNTKTYTASGGTACSVQGVLTIGNLATFNPSMTSTFNIGTVVNSGSGGTFQGRPLVLNDNIVVPTQLTGFTNAGDVWVTATKTLTLGTAQTMGAGFALDVFGNLVNNAALTMNGEFLVRGTANVSGTTPLTWGPAAGATGATIGCDLATGFPAGSLPNVSIPGFTWPASVYYRFLGPSAQVAGPAFATTSTVEGLIANTTVTLPGSLQCTQRFRVAGTSTQQGVVVSATPGSTITLGLNALLPGSFSFNFGRIDSSLAFQRFIAAAGGLRDFPMAHQGQDRIITIGATGQPTVGGSLAVRWTGSNPGGGPISLTSGSQTLVNVAPEGYYSAIAADGITFTSYDIEASAGGLVAGSDLNSFTLIKRASSGPGPWTLDGTFVAPTATTVRRAGFNGSFSDFGFGGVSGSVPVAVSGFSME